MFHFDLQALIKTAGYLGLFAIIFAESGLLIGFFLPGDSLLFTAGFLASQGFLDISLLIILMFIAAVLGDNVGYAFGRRVGPKIFKREESWLFHKEHLARSERFYSKHGGKTLVLARFTPVVRTFAPILAGVGKMHYRTFLVFNLLGALMWAVGVTLLGYYLGQTIPDIDRYLLPIIAAIIFISLLPTFLHILRDKEMREAIKGTLLRKKS
jgi:membrane-associated protein